MKRSPIHPRCIWNLPPVVQRQFIGLGFSCGKAIVEQGARLSLQRHLGPIHHSICRGGDTWRCRDRDGCYHRTSVFSSISYKRLALFACLNGFCHREIGAYLSRSSRVLRRRAGQGKVCWCLKEMSRDRASTMVVIKGAAITAGSMPTFSAAMGGRQPTILAQTRQALSAHRSL